MTSPFIEEESNKKKLSSTGKKKGVCTVLIGKERTKRKGDKIFRHSVSFPFVQIEIKFGSRIPPPAGKLMLENGFPWPVSSAGQCLVLHRNWPVESSL